MRNYVHVHVPTYIYVHDLVGQSKLGKRLTVLSWLDLVSAVCAHTTLATPYMCMCTCTMYTTTILMSI